MLSNSNAQTLSNQEAVELMTHLAKKMKCCVVCPLGLLNITTSTLISMVSMMFNYLIILVNFKFVTPARNPCGDSLVNSTVIAHNLTYTDDTQQ